MTCTFEITLEEAHAKTEKKYWYDISIQFAFTQLFNNRMYVFQLLR